MGLLNFKVKIFPKLRSRKGILSFILVLFLAGAIVWATLGYARASYFDYSDSLEAERLFYASQDVKHSYINNIRLGFADGNEAYKNLVINRTKCMFEKAASELGIDVLTTIVTAGGSEVLDLATDENNCSKCLGMAFPYAITDSMMGSCLWIDNIKRCSEKCDCEEFPYYENVVREKIDKRIDDYPYNNQKDYEGLEVSIQDTLSHCYKVSFDKSSCMAELDIGVSQNTFPMCKILTTVKNPRTGNEIVSKIPIQKYEKQMGLTLSEIESLIG